MDSITNSFSISLFNDPQNGHSLTKRRVVLDAQPDYLSACLKKACEENLGTLYFIHMVKYTMPFDLTA